MLSGDSRSDPRFMMLIADMVLSWDPEFKKHLDYYQHHRLEFRRDAAYAWKKLIELGCPEGLLTEERNAKAICACEGRQRCAGCRMSY